MTTESLQAGGPSEDLPVLLSGRCQERKEESLTPGPGTGTWSMTSSNQFQYTFTEEILDSQGTPICYVDVQQQATLSADGSTYTAFGQGMVYAMDGSALAVNPTTTQATRA